MDWTAQLARNLASVQQRLAAACERTGRAADEVTLVAVTKYADMQWVRGLYELGVRDFGESRPQQLVSRANELPGDVRWHLIGHLQRNKAALVLPVACLIHSVDSLRLAQQLQRDAEKLQRPARVLIEVNVSGEASKDGFDPADLRRNWLELMRCAHLDIDGLMTMAPLDDDPAAARPVFERLRQLRDELAALPDSPPLPQLSMGMSGDFEVGIETGATIVRVGSLLFENLNEIT